MSKKENRLSIPGHVYSELECLVRHGGKLADIVAGECDRPPERFQNDLADAIGDKYGIEFQELSKVISGLTNMRKSMQWMGMDAETLVNAICDAAKEQGTAEWKEANLALNREHANIRNALEHLTSDNSLWITRKSEEAVFRHARMVTNVSIVTDIRPVFDDEATRIDNTVVGHTLFVEFSDGFHSHRDEFMITIEDVERLGKACELAKRQDVISKERSRHITDNSDE